MKCPSQFPPGSEATEDMVPLYTVHYFETRDSHLPEPHWASWAALVIPRNIPVSASLGLGLQVCTTILCFLPCFWRLNSGPLACKARMLPTEPIPHLCFLRPVPTSFHLLWSCFRSPSLSIPVLAQITCVAGVFFSNLGTVSS